MSLTPVKSTSEDDLYGDPESSVSKHGSQNPDPEHAAGLEERLEEVKRENALLKEKLRRLQLIYDTNMPALYQFAKAELNKKDVIIKQLQQQKLKGRTSKMGGMSKSSAQTDEENLVTVQSTQKSENEKEKTDKVLFGLGSRWHL